MWVLNKRLFFLFYSFNIDASATCFDRGSRELRMILWKIFKCLTIMSQRLSFTYHHYYSFFVSDQHKNMYWVINILNIVPNLCFILSITCQRSIYIYVVRVRENIKETVHLMILTNLGMFYTKL